MKTLTLFGISNGRKKPFLIMFLLFGSLMIYLVAAFFDERVPDVPREINYSSYIPQYNSFSMDNGLSVAVLDQRKVPVITLVGAIRAGALYQSEQKQGVFHFAEHLFMSGVQDELRELGAVANAYTSQDYVYGYLSFPKEKWKQGLAVLQKIMMKSEWNEKGLQQERDVIEAEANQRISEPDKELLEQLNISLWGADAYKMNTVGTIEQIRSLDLDDMKAVYEEYFRPERSLIFAAGDLEGLNVEDDIRNSFGIWEMGRNTTSPAGPVKVPQQQNEGIFIHSPKTGLYTNLYFAWLGPGTLDSAEDTYAADLFTAWANNKSSSIGQRIIRTGIIHDYSFYYTTKRSNGTIILQASVKQEDLANAKSKLLSIVQDIDLYKKITAAQLRSTAKNIGYGYAKSMEIPSEAAKLFSIIWATDDLGYAVSYVNKINAVNSEELSQFAKHYLIESNFVWGAVFNKLQPLEKGVKEN